MPARTPGRSIAAAAVLALAACASKPIPPAVARVPVYEAPLDAPPQAQALPAGCHEVFRLPPQHWSELDREVPRDPYATQRTLTVQSGGNVLLVLSKVIVPRECVGGCPAAVPITDCPPCVGAWFDLVFVSYACPASALAKLPPERLP